MNAAKIEEKFGINKIDRSQTTSEHIKDIKKPSVKKLTFLSNIHITGALQMPSSSLIVVLGVSRKNGDIYSSQ